MSDEEKSIEQQNIDTKIDIIRENQAILGACNIKGTYLTYREDPEAKKAGEVKEELGLHLPWYHHNHFFAKFGMKEIKDPRSVSGKEKAEVERAHLLHERLLKEGVTEAVVASHRLAEKKATGVHIPYTGVDALGEIFMEIVRKGNK